MRSSILGVVLCGGRSTRMGTDKASLDFGGKPLAKWPLDAMVASGCDSVILSGASDALASALLVPTIEDVGPSRGPVSALSAVVGMADVVIVVPCDVPFVSPGDLAALGVAAGAASCDVAVAVTVELDHRRLQPLVSAWRASTKPLIDSALAAGRVIGSSPSVRSLLGELRTCEVIIDHPETLQNLNTRADVAAAAHGLGKARHSE